MSGKVGAISRPPAEKLHLPRLTMNGRPHLMDAPQNRASMSGKLGAIFRPPAEKLHLPRFTMDWAFPMNGRPDGLGVPMRGRPDEWAFR